MSDDSGTGGQLPADDFDALADELPTLDPPGSIAVIGAGPLGVEAALYGRFLGYDVTLVEAVQVGHAFRDKLDQQLPMLPDRCLSPLATAAVLSQRTTLSGADASGPDNYPLPQTYREWIDDWLTPLTETDLLRGRLRQPARVVGIATIPVSSDHVSGDEVLGNEVFGNDGDSTAIPDDFRLTLRESAEDGSSVDHTLDVEAVMVAVTSLAGLELSFEPPIDYFFQLTVGEGSDTETGLRAGWAQIVQCFSMLGGRADLDLYRPRRGA